MRETHSVTRNLLTYPLFGQCWHHHEMAVVLRCLTGPWGALQVTTDPRAHIRVETADVLL